MASGQRTVMLYWCTSADHAEDWFIFADNAQQARAYHEDYEGYGVGDSHSRLIVSDLGLTKFTNGEPPCHAQMRELFALGFEDAGSVPNQRCVRFEGKTYTEGIQESPVEPGRKPRTVTLRENCGLQREASSQTMRHDDAPGVATGPRLVDSEQDCTDLGKAATGAENEGPARDGKWLRV